MLSQMSMVVALTGSTVALAFAGAAQAQAMAPTDPSAAPVPIAGDAPLAAGASDRALPPTPAVRPVWAPPEPAIEARWRMAGGAIDEPSERDEIETELRRQLDDMRVREAAARARLSALERRLDMLESAAGLGGAMHLSENQAATMRGRGLTTMLTSNMYGDGIVGLRAGVDADEADKAAHDADAAPEDRKAPAPTEAVERVAEREQGYFGQRLSIETGLYYSYFDNARLNLSGFLALDAIFLGVISLDSITSDALTSETTVRYGLTDRLQVNASLLYLYRRSTFQSGGAGGNAAGLAEATVEDHGVGDLSFGAGYRLFRETPGRPDVVVNVRVKLPTGRHPFGVELREVPGTEGNLMVPESLSTGTGVYGASLDVSVLKTLDPMVMFGSVTYFHNFERDFDDIDEAEGNQPGWAKLGNALQYGVGVAFALNERSSLSMSFTQRFVQRAELMRKGEKAFEVIGSSANVGLLNLGATFVLSERLTLQTTVGIGMTADAPDMVVSMRLPFRL